MTGFYISLIVFLLLVIFVLLRSKITINCISSSDNDNENNITKVIENENENDLKNTDENKVKIQADDYINYFFSTSKAEGRYDKENDVLVLNGEIYRIVLNGQVIYPWE